MGVLKTLASFCCGRFHLKKYLTVLLLYIILVWIGISYMTEERIKRMRNPAHLEVNLDDDPPINTRGLNGMFHDNRKQLDQEKTVLNYSEPTCEPITEYIFADVLRGGMSRVPGVFRRFALQRRLTFLYPPHHFIWNRVLSLSSHTGRGLENEDLGNGGTLPRILFLKSPLELLEKAFNYYKIKAVLLPYFPNNTNNYFNEYLQKVAYYDSIYTSAEANKKRKCIPDGVSFSKNIMAQRLGFDVNRQPSAVDFDREFVKYWISQIQEKFTLVLIEEYLDESLVLMKRTMCWDLKDILYPIRISGDMFQKRTPPIKSVVKSPPQNALQQLVKVSKPSDIGALSKTKLGPSGSKLEGTANLGIVSHHQEQVAVALRQKAIVNMHDQGGNTKENYKLLKEWSPVDFSIYSHFLKALWARINNEHIGILDEIRHFVKVNSRVNVFCESVMKLGGAPVLTIPASEWTSRFFIDSNFCKVFRSSFFEGRWRYYDDGYKQESGYQCSI